MRFRATKMSTMYPESPRKESFDKAPIKKLLGFSSKPNCSAQLAEDGLSSRGRGRTRAMIIDITEASEEAQRPLGCILGSSFIAAIVFVAMLTFCNAELQARAKGLRTTGVTEGR
jgi:hypothetical protein